MCHNNGSALLVNCFCPCQERLHQGDTKLHAVWTSNLVSGMWQYGIDQWVGWNEFLYGKTKEERLTKKTKEVDSQIRHMHRADRKRVHSIDKHLFHMSAEQRITQTLDRKKMDWMCHNCIWSLGSTQGLSKYITKTVSTIVESNLRTKTTSQAMARILS